MFSGEYLTERIHANLTSREDIYFSLLNYSSCFQSNNNYYFRFVHRGVVWLTIFTCILYIFIHSLSMGFSHDQFFGKL